MDGIPGDEVLVSDPRATVGGKTAAGHVLVYKFDPTANAMVQVGEIADHSPETDEHFGYPERVELLSRYDRAGGPMSAGVAVTNPAGRGRELR